MNEIDRVYKLKSSNPLASLVVIEVDFSRFHAHGYEVLTAGDCSGDIIPKAADTVQLSQSSG